MKALLVYPEFPETFWSLKHAMQFLPAKATIPPLNLLTVAALMPADWPKKLVDLNIEPLTDQHLSWADMVFIGGMSIQSKSAIEVIERCIKAKVKVCLGGVMCMIDGEKFPPVDHLFLGEAEETLPVFVADLAAGQARAVYQADAFPDLTKSPTPQWDLIDFSKYLTMAVQVTRGCPYDCDFCHVVILNGRRPRTKTVFQVLTELNNLYDRGWRGPVMFVDDNFTGQKSSVRKLLAALVVWQKEHKYPFFFLSQVSLEIVDHDDLLTMLQEAGFIQLFLGIETTSAASLAECNKKQNIGRDLVKAVKTIQNHSIDVMGGFIVGFDADPPTVFDDLVGFMEEAAIPTAMVGVLAAPPETRLYKRMESEGRITGQSEGDSIANLSGMNIVPAMGWDKLLTGYQKLLLRLYESEPYFRRVLNFLQHYRANPFFPFSLPKRKELVAFFKIVWGLGVRDPERRFFWRFVFSVLTRFPQHFPLAIATILGGYHYRILTRRFNQEAARALAKGMPGPAAR
ncbi:MAG: DUF4070 domain-containing protein [Deltaproteobacteria bacterium]|nr:DUF4070 domain-containing protein [Deltaproteobacteria bacterium]